MIFSLRSLLALVTGFAVSFGAIAATVSLPPGLADIPEGCLLLVALLLSAIGFANVFAGDRPRRMFWLTFLAVLALAVVLAMIDNISACNTVPEHVARFISRCAPDIDEDVHHSNERFHALQSVLTFSGIGLVAFVGAAISSRIVRRSKDTSYADNGG